MPAEAAWHAATPEETAAALAVDVRSGLSAAAAAGRLQAHGPNTIAEPPRRRWTAIFAAQFRSPLVLILLLAAALAAFLRHGADAAVILAVVGINALLGALQEGRAERSMAALRQLASLQARVLRDGREQSLPARELVPGDVLLLASGDAVAADARLVEAAQLHAVEAALTGESVPMHKVPAPLAPETPLADRRNMVWSGTFVTGGRAAALVVATGAGTEVGRIAHWTQAAREVPTPLELRLARFGRLLLGASLALFVLITGVGFLRGLPLDEVLMVAISQMVSVVPEGLPVAMTIALAVGMQRMARRGAIVRRLAAVETLGSTSVICTDTTGTLTRIGMTVPVLWFDGR